MSELTLRGAAPLFAFVLAACGKGPADVGRAAATISLPGQTLTVRRDSGGVSVVALPSGMAVIDPADTAAYSYVSPERKGAVAPCGPPACKAIIVSGAAAGELTIQLDSANGHHAYWEALPDPPLAPDQRRIDSVAWNSTLTKWESSPRPQLLLVDSVPRSYNYVRQHVRLEDVWGMQEVSAAAARRLSKDPAAASGAVVITTRAHAPPPPKGQRVP
ncbi:MAG: hypothetical protein ACRENQ_09975 [Gemmatimonadaceae bacterium]